MTTTLLEPAAVRADPGPARRLRVASAAVRVLLRWFGVRKTLTPEQKTQAAETFNAEGDYLSARKKLLDTKHPAYKGVTAVRGRVISFWKAVTLPFPEPGVRLISHDQVEPFNEQLTEFRAQLDESVLALDGRYAELRGAARRRLGRLYNPADYPESLVGLFGVECDFPNVEPPQYLMRLSPELYEQEKARVAARFEEAVRLAEQGFIAEFARLVSHLTERIAAGPGEGRKVFRDTMVNNLRDFFSRFNTLNVRSNADLDRLVEQAQDIVRGVGAQDLRDNDGLRQHVAAEMTQVQSALDGMLVDRPRRRIVRANPSTNGGSHDSRN